MLSNVLVDKGYSENNMATLFYRNYRLTALCVALIIVSGLMSLNFIPRMEDPLLTARAASVTTLLPGADAERVAALVTEKIEAQLKGIEEIKDVTSDSRSSLSFIIIELRNDLGAGQVPNVWSKVRGKLEDARLDLPEAATKPDLEQLDSRAFSLIVGLKWERDSEPNYAILTRLLEQLREQVEQITGTERGEIFGDPEEEVLVTIKPEVISSLNLNATAISGAIEASDAKVPAGRLRSVEDEMLLEVSGELDTLSRLSRVPIRLGGGGESIELADIAFIEKSIRSPASSAIVLDSKHAVVLAVMVNSTAQLDNWSTAVIPVLANFEKNLPLGVSLDIVFEQQPLVSTRMRSLLLSLLFGAIGILIVIWLMMGFRCAWVVCFSLPLGCLMVLAIMYVMEISINQMSITGLIIALGLMIDNSIVMVDEIEKRIGAGYGANRAVGESVQFLAIPLLGSTLTTVFSFGPIALMQGPSGEFVGSIAVVTILAVMSSLVLSLTVVSAIAGASLGPKSPNVVRRMLGRVFKHVRIVYQSILIVIYRRPVMGVLASLTLPFAGFWAATTLEEQFFPPSDRKQFQVEMELPGTSSLEETKYFASRAGKILMERRDVTKVSWFLGESAPVFYYNVVPDRKNASRYGQAIVECSEDADMKSLIRQIQNQLDRELPEAICLARQLEQGPPFSAPIEVQIFGPDAEQLRLLGEELRSVMNATAEVLHTRSDFSEAVPKIKFAVDEYQSRISGLDHQQIAMSLNSMLEGVTGGSILEGTQELPVRVRVAGEQRADINKIASLNLIPMAMSGPDGSIRSGFNGVPLGAISELKLDAEQAGLRRKNGRLMNEIQGYITTGTLPATVLRDFNSRLAASGFELPVGYEIQYAGAEGERDEAVASLVVNTVVLVALMIATLVLALQSFRLMVVLFAVAGLSVGYGLGTIWLAGFSWGFMSIVGMMGMIGVAVNDSIVMLAALRFLTSEQLNSGVALVKCVSENTRHILATSITTVVGFAPLFFAGGDFWPPVAASISGGVVGAMGLALVFVPCIYLLMFRRSSAGAV